MQIVRTEGDIEERILPQDHLRHARLLDHAAAGAKHEPRILPLEFLQPRHVAQRLALGVIADAAGVEKDQLGLLARGGGRHAHLVHHARENFGIMRVHLAAVGYDKI